MKKLRVSNLDPIVRTSERLQDVEEITSPSRHGYMEALIYNTFFKEVFPCRVPVHQSLIF